jgi:hypothetical protein
MARGNLAHNEFTRSGTGLADPSPTTGDPVNNHQTTNDGKVVLRVENTNGASTARVVTIHFDAAATVDGVAPANRTYSVAAGATAWLGPYDAARYGNPLLIDVDNAELQVTAFHITPA